MSQSVWVVETIINRGARIPLWCVWSAHMTRSAAWAEMRTARARHPAERFRAVRYVPAGGSR